MKIKKLLASILVVVLLFAFANTAFAYAPSSISTSSSTTNCFAHDVSRSYTSFSLSGNAYITTYGSATSLTVRAYTLDHTKLSNAKTYRSGALSGGQAYWDTPAKICVRCNNDSNGDMVKVGGTWHF